MILHLLDACRYLSAIIVTLRFYLQTLIHREEICNIHVVCELILEGEYTISGAHSYSAATVGREGIWADQKWNMVVLVWVFNLEWDLDPWIETFSPSPLKIRSRFESKLINPGR